MTLCVAQMNSSSDGGSDLKGETKKVHCICVWCVIKCETQEHAAAAVAVPIWRFTVRLCENEFAAQFCISRMQTIGWLARWLVGSFDFVYANVTSINCCWLFISNSYVTMYMCILYGCCSFVPAPLRAMYRAAVATALQIYNKCVFVQDLPSLRFKNEL